MKEPSGREMGRRIVDVVRGYVARTVAPMLARVKALEGQQQDLKSLEPLLREMLGAALRELPQPTPGKDGKDGQNGRDGESVAPEAVERIVEQRVAAAIAKVQLPRDGRDGEPGRDGADIHILPSIDEAKSYPRGTFANHLGGLWRSVAKTSGMQGWECIVSGIAGTEVAQSDVRNFVVRIRQSDGAATEAAFVLPVVIDRGVYVPEAKYLKGDGVTWAGSWWIAQADEPTDKPGISDQWRLAVKRGRDGKDAQK